MVVRQEDWSGTQLILKMLCRQKYNSGDYERMNTRFLHGERCKNERLNKIERQNYKVCI